MSFEPGTASSARPFSGMASSISERDRRFHERDQLARETIAADRAAREVKTKRLREQRLAKAAKREDRK